MVKKQFRTEKSMFADALLFGIKSGKKRVVIADNNALRNNFIYFLKERKANISDQKVSDGFYVTTNADDVDISAEDSVCIWLFSCEPQLLPCEIEGNSFCAILNMDFENDDDFWLNNSDSAEDVSYPRVECFLKNNELKPMFTKTFRIAEREIDLICPWLNTYVVNEELMRLLHEALKRNVKIKIEYGIGQGEDPREKTSEDTVDMLKSRFSWTNLLELKKGNTHIKYLICDDKYMMCGSYNFLSFAADYEKSDERDEGMEFIVDKNQIETRRKQLFSW